MTVENTTISGNTAENGGGVIVFSDSSYEDDGEKAKFVLRGTTIANNVGQWGGGINLRDGYLELDRSLVSGNAADAGPNLLLDTRFLDGEDPVYFHSEGYNLLGALGVSGVQGMELETSDIVPQVELGAILSGLSGNGGPTLTHALVPDSPAIDQAFSIDCSGETDQRGVVRNIDGNDQPSFRECGIGAFERDHNSPTATVTTTVTATATETPFPSVTWTSTPSETPIGSTATPSPSQTPTAASTQPPRFDFRLVIPMLVARTEPTQTPLPTATATFIPTVTPTKRPTVTPRPTATVTRSPSCDPSYPTVCILSPPPDLDCPDIPYRNFLVLPPDPHRFDSDKDGIGCEQN